ncbi:MAG: DUF2956 domain-containing protein [Thalassotalea sp.]
MKKEKPSQAIQETAVKVAKANQKPGQTKEQTKLISQGIEKGIAEYKKQQSKINRERDKAKKIALKQQAQQIDTDELKADVTVGKANVLPWLLLVVSWLSFIIYVIIS